jgi:hypothetical protein
MSTVNGQLGLGLKRALAGSGWAGLGRTGPDTWQAVALPCRSRGPPLGLVHKHGLRWAQALVYGGLRLLPVNRVHPSLSVVRVHRVHVRVAGKGKPLLPPPACSRR